MLLIYYFRAGLLLLVDEYCLTNCYLFLFSLLLQPQFAVSEFGV